MFKNALVNLICLIVLVDFKTFSQDKNVTIEFIDVRTNKGNLGIGIFKTEEEFKTEKAFKSLNLSKANLKNGKLSASISLPNGTYGISVLDDENNNNKMDYNFIGIPKEGFAFSNYYHSGFSKPKLIQFQFTINNNNEKLVCKFRYM